MEIQNTSSSSENEATESMPIRVQKAALRQMKIINENLRNNRLPNTSIEFEIFDCVGDKNEDTTWNIVSVRDGETREQHVGQVLEWIVENRIKEIYQIENEEELKSLSRLLPEDSKQKYYCYACGNDDEKYFLEKKDGVTCLGKNGARNCSTLIQQGFIYGGQEFRNFVDSEDRNTQDSSAPNVYMSNATNNSITAAGSDKFGKEAARMENEMKKEHRNYQSTYHKSGTTDEKKDADCMKYFGLFRNFVLNKHLSDTITERSKKLFHYIRRKTEKLQRAKSYAVACLIIAYYEDKLSGGGNSNFQFKCSFCGRGCLGLETLKYHEDFLCDQRTKEKKSINDQNQIPKKDTNTMPKKKGLLGAPDTVANSNSEKIKNGEDIELSPWENLDMMYWDENHIIGWLESIDDNKYYFQAEKLVEVIKENAACILQFSRKYNESDSDGSESDEGEDKMTGRNGSTKSNQHLGWYLMHKTTQSDFARAFAEAEEESETEDNEKNKTQKRAALIINGDARQEGLNVYNHVMREKEKIKDRKKREARRQKTSLAKRNDRNMNQHQKNKKVTSDRENKHNNFNTDSTKASIPLNGVTSATLHSKRKADETEHGEAPSALRQRTNDTIPSHDRNAKLQDLCTEYIQLRGALTSQNLTEDQRRIYGSRFKEVKLVLTRNNVQL